MKRLNQVFLTASLALICLPACAGHRDHGYDYARVVSATPVYEIVRYPVDEQVCWLKRSRKNAHHAITLFVPGGGIGVSHYPATRRHCEIQRSWRQEKRIAAWDVTYRYHGQFYQTRRLEEPGKKIRVPAYR